MWECLVKPRASRDTLSQELMGGLDRLPHDGLCSCWGSETCPCTSRILQRGHLRWPPIIVSVRRFSWAARITCRWASACVVLSVVWASPRSWGCQVGRDQCPLRGGKGRHQGPCEGPVVLARADKVERGSDPDLPADKTPLLHAMPPQQRATSSLPLDTTPQDTGGL